MSNATMSAFLPTWSCDVEASHDPRTRPPHDRNRTLDAQKSQSQRRQRRAAITRIQTSWRTGGVAGARKAPSDKNAFGSDELPLNRKLSVQREDTEMAETSI